MSNAKTKQQQQQPQKAPAIIQHPKKVKPGKPPPIDKLLIPAIGIALALLGYQFFKGISSEIKRVNLDDELEIREVFFGEEGTGKSYIVLCHEEESKIPLSSVFQDAFKDGTAPAEFRVLDCNHILPDSGKSIMERFKLDIKSRPTIFLSGATGEPQQIPVKHLKTGAMLVKVLKNKLEPRAAKVETTQDLRTKCLDKDVCALLLKGSKTAPAYLKDAMSKLLVEYPKISFAAIDSTVLYVYNLEEYLPELADEQPRFVVFKKISGSLETKGERLITSIAPLSNNGVSYGQMSNLVASVVSNKVTMEKIPQLPTIKTRSKKIEQEERAKRERKNNRQKAESASSSSSGSTGSSSFRDNDGTADGRRAERERRRKDHNQKHNIKPKTPEEIAEMERQRRVRMEEEAKKWNVAPEDLPPEGDINFEEEESLDDIMEGGEDGVYVEDRDYGDAGSDVREDDEDVIDLD